MTFRFEKYQTHYFPFVFVPSTLLGEALKKFLQADIFLVTDSMTLRAHKAILFPLLPTLSSFSCSSCQAHDPLVLLLPGADPRLLQVALEHAYTRNSAGNLEVQLGLVFNVTCHLCRQRFPSEGDLEAHHCMMKPNFTCNLCGKLIYSSTELDSHICANLVDGNEPIHIYETATNVNGYQKEKSIDTKIPIEFIPAKDSQEIERDEPTMIANKEEKPEELDLSTSRVVSSKNTDKEFCHKDANDKVSDGNPRQFDKQR